MLQSIEGTCKTSKVLWPVQKVFSGKKKHYVIVKQIGLLLRLGNKNPTWHHVVQCARKRPISYVEAGKNVLYVPNLNTKTITRPEHETHHWPLFGEENAFFFAIYSKAPHTSSYRSNLHNCTEATTASLMTTIHTHTFIFIYENRVVSTAQCQ